jgi:hypothetical protein
VKLKIRISDETAAELSERARSVGEDLAEYVAGMLERATASTKILREISGPVAKQFEKSGMTDDELGEFLEEVKHKLRRERRNPEG